MDVIFRASCRNSGHLGTMLIKCLSDHVVKQSPTCGEIREILRGEEFSPNIALAIDIGTTSAHYHLGFDEIYLVLDGSLHVRLFDPSTETTSEALLGPGELCVITRGIHHQVVEASQPNRLCVITTPGFQPADEHLSDRL